MLRSVIRWSLFSLLAAACLVGTAAGPTAAEKKAKGKKAAAKAAAKEKETAPSLEKLLATRIDLDNGFEKNTPLKDALESLSSEHKLPIVIDHQAFAAVSVAQPEETPVQLPKMKGVRLGTVITMLARQIPGESGHAGAFLIRPDFVEITTTNAVAVEVWGQHFTGPYLPLVHVRFEGRPLEQAIKELADSTSINVILDQRAKDQAQTEVTARFVNTPLDTAVRFLADMAELQAVLLDNVIYVTSPQNAAILQQRIEKEGQIREGEGPRPRVGSAGFGFRGAAAPAAGAGFSIQAGALIGSAASSRKSPTPRRLSLPKKPAELHAKKLAKSELLALNASVPAPQPAKEAAKEEKRVHKLRDTMNKPVTLDRGIEKNTPLKDALEFLSDRYDFTFVIDPKAFAEMDMPPIEERVVELSKLNGVKLGTVLKLLLSQVNATTLVRNDYVLIASRACANPAEWAGIDRSTIPTVTVEFEKKPLEEALREVADSTGINILLDGRAGDQAKAAVTAQLNNSPVDTAVRVLADMADLKPVILDNVFYVTTKENAKVLELERQKPASSKESKTSQK